MAQSIVPIKVRPHLIPFFYKEFKADTDAHYLKNRVRACKIVINSSLGKMIRITLEKSDYPVKPQKFYIYFSVPDKVSDKATAEIYQTVKGSNSFLKVPEKVASDINDIFEDLFRYNFVLTVSTALKYAPNLKVEKVILDFMTEYNLEEHGFRLDTMRSLYNREMRESLSLKRFQSKSSNRVLNFSK
ncbi:hypothetical protein [Polaribacter atrinae]|uniref:hypothetical protein n=1 Tax=Polaribacter atrinae TaxID=1333662 RepID=UPI0030F50FE6